MKREIKWIEICRTLAMAMIVFAHVIDYAVSTGKDAFGVYLSHIAVLTGLLIGWEVLGLPGALWPKLLVMPVLTWIIYDALVRLCRLHGLGILNRFVFGGRG